VPTAHLRASTLRVGVLMQAETYRKTFHQDIYDQYGNSNDTKKRAEQPKTSTDTALVRQADSARKKGYRPRHSKERITCASAHLCKMSRGEKALKLQLNRL
jgi:hypothetical protein